MKYYNELCVQENIFLIIINWLCGIFVVFVIAVVIDQIRLFLFTKMYPLIGKICNMNFRLIL